MSDYIGKPIAAYNGVGNLVWDVEYDIFGNIRSQSKGNKDFIPFRNQGQYEDSELNGLMYNRFRYYDGNSGTYISQDPIRLLGGNPNLYSYVKDTNTRMDALGLSDCSNLNVDTGTARAIIEGSSSEIDSLIANKKLFMSQTAVDELNDYASRYNKQSDVSNFMSNYNVSVVPDNPSARASALTTTKKVGESDKIIFGTGDQMGMPTITSDAKFVRGVSARGVDFDAIVHSPI